jgi:FdhD protein
MSSRRAIVRVLSSSGERTSLGDDLTVEAPLNLVIDGAVIATLMRTPGHDLELAAGWLVVESGVRDIDDLRALRQCRTDDDLELRTEDATAGRGVDQVHLALADGVTPPRPRAWVTSASCGVCSADVLDLSPLRWSEPHRDGWCIAADVLATLPDRVRSQQKTFQRTGSLHAAGIATSIGDLLVVREDVGRHNAVDKVSGWALFNSVLPARDLVLTVSGRVSFEIVQKAVAAGFAGIAAVSAPSDLAVDLAREHDLLLAGMIRSDKLNLYSGADSVTGR